MADPNKIFSNYRAIKDYTFSAPEPAPSARPAKRSAGVARSESHDAKPKFARKRSKRGSLAMEGGAAKVRLDRPARGRKRGGRIPGFDGGGNVDDDSAPTRSGDTQGVARQARDEPAEWTDEARAVLDRVPAAVERVLKEISGSRPAYKRGGRSGEERMDRPGRKAPKGDSLNVVLAPRGTSAASPFTPHPGLSGPVRGPGGVIPKPGSDPDGPAIDRHGGRARGGRVKISKSRGH